VVQPVTATTSVSAALTGLLFIALSIDPRAILSSAEHRGRAREALGQFLAVLVASVAALIPGQTPSALGTEMLVVCGGVVAASIRFQSETLRTLPADQRQRWLLRLVIPDLATL
jgi:modulator of FtsH protease